MVTRLNRGRAAHMIGVWVILGVAVGLGLAQAQQPPKDAKTQNNGATTRPAPGSMPAEFQPTDGWEWVITPRKIEPGISHLVVLSREDEEASQSWQRMGGFATAIVPRKAGMAYQAAAFDEHRTRIELGCSAADDGFGSCAISHIQQAGAAYAGIEALTPEAREKAASLAFEKAKKKGLSPLPYAGDQDVPETWPKGVYDFELSIGGPVTRDSFPGKIIIIDCWATWCTPCMELMPELVELSKKHEKEVSVISISYDDDPKKAEKKLKSLGVEWPLFVLPRNAGDRALWLTAFQGKKDGGVPVIIVIDQKGRMRHVYPFQLAATIDKLLER